MEGQKQSYIGLMIKVMCGKCSLASAVRAQDPGDVKSEWANKQRKNAGCPKPVYYGDYRDCPYVLGMWKKE